MHNKEAKMGNESKKSAQIWAYLTGTFSARFANNALQVTFPLLLLQFSNSLSAVGFITALTTAVDTTGTLLGGWFSHYLHPRTLLIASTAIRSVILALIPSLWVAKSLTLHLAVGIYLLDSLARGVADTARNTLPMMLVGKDKDALDSLNSRYQTVFELGAVTGPFLAGGLLVGFGALAANWLIPIAFAVSTAIYLMIPKTGRPSIQEGERNNEPTLRNSIGLIASKPDLRLPFIGILLLTLYPLKALLPALFADSILKAPEQAAWLVGLFGLGALVGSVLYSPVHGKISPPAWLRWSAIGVLLLATGWIPGTLLPMAVAIFLFALSNVMARLSMVSLLQSQIPQNAEGSVMGLTRCSVNLTSALLRFMVGLAFALALSSEHAFALVGAGLGLFAVLELWVSRCLGNYIEAKKGQRVVHAEHLLAAARG
jgi:MFS family permease